MSLIVKVICKAYEWCLRIYTRIFYVSVSDPTRLLVDFMSPLQTELQNKIDSELCNRPFVGKILVVVPFKDRWDLTEACLNSLSNQKLNAILRVVLMNNQSREEQTLQGLENAKLRWPSLSIEILNANYPFNYSKLNNDAVRFGGEGIDDQVLFLNNDVQLIDQTILQRMSDALACHNDIGVVGSTLYFPDHTIQHLFAATGVKIVAAHPYRYRLLPTTCVWFEKPVRVVPAVTGALMLIRRQDFLTVGMFDEQLATLGQDIDLCERVFATLQKVPVVVTNAEVIHHESKTKGGGFARNEIEHLYKKGGTLSRPSPLYSDRFSRWSETPVIKPLPGEPPYPWRWFV